MKQPVEAEILKPTVLPDISEMFHRGGPEELSGATCSDAKGFETGIGSTDFVPICHDLPLGGEFTGVSEG